VSLDLHLARLAYEAYSTRAAGKSWVNSDSLPPFHELPENLRDAWVAAANAVAEEVIRPRQPFELPELD
jgi:hypothetical protein